MAAKRILILDDEPNIGASLRLILEREGYAVSIARTVAEAKAISDRVDALLLDVRLPDGSGIDLLRYLRERDHPAPAIMISGHATIADAVEATRAGAFDFLEKPLAATRFCSRSRTLWNRSICDAKTSACGNWWVPARA